MLNSTGIIVVVLLLFFLTYILRSNSLDSFIVFVDDVIIPKNCYDYLVTNGKYFFLINSKKTMDNITNPITFNNKQDAINYLNKINCPNTIPFVDLVMKKKLDDPTVSMQRECAKKISPNLFDLDVCNLYGSNSDTLNAKTIARLNQIENDRKIYSNYDLESCMINNAVSENEDLDDANFKNDFAKYFDRLNSHIDAKYLYIT